MTNTFNINAENGLPTADELSQALAIHKQVAIQYTSLPESYIPTLTYSLPDCTIYNREWGKTVFVFPSIHNERILLKKVELYECAKSFREDANYLMGIMASTFGIDLQTFDGFFELKFYKSKKQRGMLNEEWSYFLHGSECRFEHISTGQLVEVILSTRPEFGYLDCYFFYNYMATTERFKNLAAFFDNDHRNIFKAIDLLVLEGVLTRFPDILISRNVIAI